MLQTAAISGSGSCAGRPWWFGSVGLAAILFFSSASTSAAQTPTVQTIAAELRDNRAEQALRDANRALGVQPSDARLWTLKGLAAKMLGDPAGALTSFDSALRLAPAYLPALEGAAELSYKLGRPEAAQRVDQLLKSLPEDPTANAMAAMLCYRDRSWVAAAAHFDKSAPAIADQQSAFEAYAETLLHLSRGHDAEIVLNQLITRWPKDQNSRYRLAVLQSQGHTDVEALQTLQPLLAINDNSALSLAASIEEAKGNTPKAIELLSKAIQLAPAVERNYVDLAAISFDHSSSAAGVAILNAGLTQKPNSAPLHVARGILYMQISKVEEAEEDFETANRLDPSQTFGLEAQGLTEMQRHNLPEALSKVRQSLNQNPQSAYLNYLAAEIVKEQGAAPKTPQAEQALAYANRAVELDPKLVAARDLLATLEFEAGHLGVAEQECRIVLQQKPEDQEAVFRLILVLRRSHDRGGEIPELVSKLKQLRAAEHASQVKIDTYRLSQAPPG